MFSCQKNNNSKTLIKVNWGFTEIPPVLIQPKAQNDKVILSSDLSPI